MQCFKNDISEDKKRKAKGNIEAFYLKESYLYHRDIISEVYVKSSLYNRKQIDSILRTMQATGLKIDQIYRLVFGNYFYEGDLGKRVLAKFTRDIVKDTPGLRELFWDYPAN